MNSEETTGRQDDGSCDARPGLRDAEAKVLCMRSQVEVRLPPEPIAPSLARTAVAAVASGLPEAVASDIELLATEIVSNASRHASMDPSEEIMGLLVGARGFEPLASSASRNERATS
jgi:hypothetical protein